jgi:hypothetical protein
LIHRQGNTVELFIIAAETAIQTVIGTEIGNIKWREQNKAVAINGFFDLVCRLPDQSDQFIIFRLEKNGNFFGRETFELPGFCYNFSNSFGRRIFGFNQYVFNF